MLAGYLMAMGTVAIGLRAPPGLGKAARLPGPGPHRAVRRGWGGLIRGVTGTAVGGYLLLTAVMIVYYSGVAGQSGHFLASAFTGTALLVGVAVRSPWMRKLGRGCRDRPL
jgi:Family of unknown function (DUF6256)